MNDHGFYRLRARLGGLAKAARHAPQELTRPARDGRWQRYLAKADPDGALPEAERIRRAEALRRLDMTRMGLKSAQARQRRSRQQEAPDVA
jgi:hypothetical protein